MLRPVDVISPGYVQMQRALHASPRGYGQRGHKWAPVVLAVADGYGATSILDYGCGQGALGQALRQNQLGAIRLDEYDPAIPGKDGWPSFADLVVCTDVLEHIEPEKLPAVLSHLRMLARKAVLVVVSLVETAKMLEDGRNAHLIVQPASWWVEQFESAGFRVMPPPDLARKKPEKEWIGVLIP